MRLTASILILFALVSTSALAQGDCPGNEYGFVVHFEDASYAGCSQLDDDVLDCDALAAAGATGVDQFAWLVTYGWENIPGWPIGPGLGGVEFGIEYDPTVDVLSWSLCTGGNEIPQDDENGTWPESHTGNAMTWGSADYMQPSGFAKVGYLTIAAGSAGRLAIIDDPRIGAAYIASGYHPPFEPQQFEVPPTGWSVGSVDGSGPTCKTCDLMGTPITETSWSRLRQMY